MPSAKKSLTMFNRINDEGDPFHLLHIMNADHGGAVHDRRRDRGGSAFKPFFDRKIKYFSDERFARGADKNRIAKPLKFLQSPDKFQIMFRRFTETDSRINKN